MFNISKCARECFPGFPCKKSFDNIICVHFRKESFQKSTPTLKNAQRPRTRWGKLEYWGEQLCFLKFCRFRLKNNIEKSLILGQLKNYSIKR